MKSSTPILFLEPALDELREAVQYYNEQEPGLGFEFAQEIRLTLGRIRENPEAWPVHSHRTHRCRTNRFPYGIVYHPSLEEILVIAVMHLRRKPMYWRNRV
ncbi:MAG: type II toxin-antitoxin system RelE/ParE family toxin [Spirochaetota bacterium]